MIKRLTFLIISISCFSCENIIGVEDISDMHVSVLAPKGDVSLDDNEVTFTWESLEEAENYKIQIATPNFKEAKQIVLDSLVSNTHITKLLQSGSYSWRVRAENSGYVTSYSTQSFTVIKIDSTDNSDKNAKFSFK